MVNVFCTRKLEKLVDMEITNVEPSTLDESWNAHLVAIGGRKNILFVHKKTLYGILLVDVLKKDLLQIDRLFYDAFVAQLKNDRIYRVELEAVYRQRFDKVLLLPTDNDRKTIGTIRDLILHLKSYCAVRPNKIEAARYFAQNTMNGIPIGSRKYAQSKNSMAEEMKTWNGLSEHA